MIYFESPFGQCKAAGIAEADDRMIVMKQFYLNLNTTKKAALISILIIVLNIAAVFASGVAYADIESETISVFSFILSGILFAVHIAFCIFMRIYKKPHVTLAVFFYQLVGVISYILFFIGFVAGQGAENGLTAFFSVFRWWTVGYQNFFIMLARFTGIPFKFSGAVLYMLLTYVTASMYAATKKDIRYEEEKKKEKEYIEKTRNRFDR